MSHPSFYRGLPISAHWNENRTKAYSRQQKGKIAESAASFRCVLHGRALYVSPFDGDKADRIAETPDGRFLKIQVRWCKRSRQGGSPMIRLTSVGNNRVVRRAKEGDLISSLATISAPTALSCFLDGGQESVRSGVCDQRVIRGVAQAPVA